jgi:tetratricopeptide (TPR) repeat protein
LAKRHAGIPSARSWNPSVPKDLDALLSKCLDPAPEKRYDSAAQLADDLSLFLRDYPLGHLPHIPLSVRMHKFTRRNRRALAGTALLAITVSFSAVYLRHERVARGRAESQINQLQVTAEKEADAAMAVLPNDSYKYFLLGRDYFIARQFTHARRCFSRVIELTPDYAHAYLYRGRCFANLDKDSEALSDYTLSIKHDPENVYPFLMRAICYATSDRFGSTDKAVADLKEVEKLMPADEEESTKVIYMEVARTYSAISARSSSTEQKTVFLRLAEENLLIAIDLGLAMDYLNEVRRNDRFQMLEPLLKQQRVKKLLIDRGLTLR